MRICLRENYPKCWRLWLESIFLELLPHGMWVRGKGKRMGRLHTHPLALLAGNLFSLRKDKLGSGSGGADSFVEILGHYMNIVRFDPPSPPNPCVFLEVIGPRLIVSLAACTAENDVCVSPAVVFINHMVTACPDVLYGRVAALFAALRRLFTTIASECIAF